jgi:hypothetical protein
MKLYEIAHSRTGDKGDISNISVIVYDKKDYPLIVESDRRKSQGILQRNRPRRRLPL